jgi:2-polyprenyl-3-methyl-5-hydroxy-6-metoxy-1,4-benzoquinol methylase|uniref:Methyltransferase type 12 domain-containing protein n=1 Tax=viral metagenome TaxID=1070528 RepID=A0A6C0CBT6_9ZZZZ
MTENKDAIKEIEIITNYWNNCPCNLNHSMKEIGTKDYFDEVENKKHFVEPHILEFADFSKWKHKKVLEIGCGIGTASVNFIRNGANYTGLELSDKSLELTKQRLHIYNLNGLLYNLNAENNIDFLGLESYDLIYSFGVIHHSPNPEKIIKNAYNLLKPGGTLKIMVYAENSWKKMLIDNERQQYEAQNGCPLAYTYTNNQIYDLLKDYKNIQIKQTHIFPYKIEDYKKGIYIKEDWIEAMSEHLFKILEEKLGWHLCVTCNK